MGNNILDNLVNNKLFYARLIAKLSLYDYFAKSSIGLIDDIDILHKKLRKALDILNDNNFIYNDEKINQLLSSSSEKDFFFNMNMLSEKNTNYEKILTLCANLTNLVFVGSDVNEHINQSTLLFRGEVLNTIFEEDRNHASRQFSGINTSAIRLETTAERQEDNSLSIIKKITAKTNSSNRTLLETAERYTDILDSTVACLSFNAISNYMQFFANYNGSFQRYYSENILNFLKSSNVQSLSSDNPQRIEVTPEGLYIKRTSANDHFENSENHSKIFKVLFNNNFIFELERNTAAELFDNTVRTISDKQPSGAADFLIYERIKNMENIDLYKNYAKTFYSNTNDTFKNIIQTLGLNFDDTGNTLVENLNQKKENINPLAYFNYYLNSFAKGLQETFPNLYEYDSHFNCDDKIALSYNLYNLLYLSNSQSYKSIVLNKALQKCITNDSEILEEDKIFFRNFIDESIGNFSFTTSVQFNESVKDNVTKSFTCLNNTNLVFDKDNYDNYIDIGSKVARDPSDLGVHTNLLSKAMNDRFLSELLQDFALKSSGRSGSATEFANNTGQGLIHVEDNALFKPVSFKKEINREGIEYLEVDFGLYDTLKQISHLDHVHVFYQYFCFLFKRCIPVFAKSSLIFGNISLQADPIMIALFVEALKNSDSSLEAYNAAMPFEKYVKVFYNLDITGTLDNAVDLTVVRPEYEGKYYQYFKAVCNEINKVKQRIIDRKDGIMTGLKYLLKTSSKLLDFEKSFENIFGIDDQAKYNKFLINLLEKNKMLDTISCISSFQKNAAFLSYIKNFSITKDSFPFTKNYITSVIEQKVMFRFLTKENYGYLKKEREGSKQILHLGITNGMFDQLRQGEGNKNLILIKVNRINYLNENEKTIPNYYVFDMSKYFLPCYFDENNKVKENFLFRQYSDNLPFKFLIPRSQFFRYKNKKIIPAGLGRSAFGTESAEDELSNFYKSMGQDYLNEFKDGIIMNHLDSYFLNLYTKSTLGIDLRINSLNVISENNFYGSMNNGENETKFYSDVNSYVNDNVFRKEDKPNEYAIYQNFLKTWSFLNAEDRFNDVSSFKIFDRTFSLLLNSNDFLFDPLETELEQETQSGQPLRNINLVNYNSVYRLNGKLHKKDNFNFGNPLVISENPVQRYIEGPNKIYGYAITISLLKGW